MLFKKLMLGKNLQHTLSCVHRNAIAMTCTSSRSFSIQKYCDLKFDKRLLFCARRRRFATEALQPIVVDSADFRTIREENALYVDKTEMIYSLVRDEGALQINRPRKFGKSLMLSTMAEMLGPATEKEKMELFKGLWVAENDEGKALLKQQHPVLHFDFARLDATNFRERLLIDVKKKAKVLGAELTLPNDLSACIEDVLLQAAEGGEYRKGVVVLVDEVFFICLS